MMRHLGNTQFNGKTREKVADQINCSQDNQENCSYFGHKVGGVKDMQNLHQAQSDQKIGQKNAQNVESPQFKNVRTQPADTEQESNRQKKNREGARIDTIYQGRNNHQRQQPLAALA